jgi:hypothetical protein
MKIRITPLSGRFKTRRYWPSHQGPGRTPREVTRSTLEIQTRGHYQKPHPCRLSACTAREPHKHTWDVCAHNCPKLSMLMLLSCRHYVLVKHCITTRVEARQLPENFQHSPLHCNMIQSKHVQRLYPFATLERHERAWFLIGTSAQGNVPSQPKPAEVWTRFFGWPSSHS